MKLHLERKLFTAESTIGELTIDGAFECLTLEDPVRDEKIAGATAIPAGTYELVVNNSSKFGRRMPRLLDVPNFEGILIHWGNTAKDTEGCILVGTSKAKDFIGSSKAAFDALFKKLSQADKDGVAMSIRVT